MPTEEEIAFPSLTDSDLAIFRRRGHPRTVRAGDILFSEGDRNFCFYIVVEGAIAIVEHSRRAFRASSPQAMFVADR